MSSVKRLLAISVVAAIAGLGMATASQAEVVTNKLAANRLAANKLAANRISLNRLAANRITFNKLAANRIALNKLAANRIALNRLAANRSAANRTTSSPTTLRAQSPGAGSVDSVVAIQLPSAVTRQD